MTTAFPMKSKCPNCGKEYDYLEVLSHTIYGDFTDECLLSLLESYNKTCDCGTKFNMSEENHKNKDLNNIIIEGYIYPDHIKKLKDIILNSFDKRSI